MSKFSYLTICIVMLICEPVYSAYTDVIKPPSYGTGVNTAPGINETKNTNIHFKKSYISFKPVNIFVKSKRFIEGQCPFIQPAGNFNDRKKH